MINPDPNRFRTEPADSARDEGSPERWRLHIIGPAIAIYAACAIAVTVLSLVR
jgi:hypothetical protein